jgi:hypothetical protein
VDADTNNVTKSFLGSDLCQRFYFGRPVSADMLETSAERLKLAYRTH